MAVNKKGRRTVRVHGREYIWFIRESPVAVPDAGFVEHRRVRDLHIIATDKQLMVRYRHPQPGDAHALLAIEGPFFPRRPGAREIEVPRWRRDLKYPNPDFVRRLINWCLDPEAV